MQPLGMEDNRPISPFDAHVGDGAWDGANGKDTGAEVTDFDATEATPRSDDGLILEFGDGFSHIDPADLTASRDAGENDWDFDRTDSVPLVVQSVHSASPVTLPDDALHLPIGTAVLHDFPLADVLPTEEKMPEDDAAVVPPSPDEPQLPLDTDNDRAIACVAMSMALRPSSCDLPSIVLGICNKTPGIAARITSLEGVVINTALAEAVAQVMHEIGAKPREVLRKLTFSLLYTHAHTEPGSDVTIEAFVRRALGVTSRQVGKCTENGVSAKKSIILLAALFQRHRNNLFHNFQLRTRPTHH